MTFRSGAAGAIRVLLAAALLLSSGCATYALRRDWREAEQVNSIEAYENFRAQHPRSAYNTEVQRRVEELNWRTATSLNSVDGYERFLALYPESTHRTAADSLMEELDWKQAQDLNTIEAYRSFTGSHPASRYRSTAETRIEELELARTRATNTIEAYEEFLATHEIGSCADEARADLQRLKDQIRVVEAATREVLSSEAQVEVTAVSQFPRKPQILVAAHLLEGHSPDETSPYVQGDYTTNEKLARLVRLRCAEIIRSVAARANLPDASELTVRACHGVRQHINSWATPGHDVAMTLYQVTIPLDRLRTSWSDRDLEHIMGLWTVDEDITQQVRISTEFFHW